MQLSAIEASETDSSISKKWELLKFGNIDSLPLSFRCPKLNINELDSTINGNDGCNNYNGQLNHFKENLKFKNIRATKMACMNHFKLTNLYHQYLSNTNTYKLRSNLLYLYDLNGSILLIFKEYK